MSFSGAIAILAFLCGLAAFEVAPVLAVVSLVVAGAATSEVWRDVRQRFS